MKITDQQLEEALGKEYSIKLSGSVLGYILQLLADEQASLNEDMAKNITDPMAAMMAGANDIVGNTVLHAVYKGAGPTLLAIAMGVEQEAIDRLMKAKSPGEIETAAKKMGKAFGPNPLDKRKMH